MGLVVHEGYCTRGGVSFTLVLHNSVARGMGVVGWWCTAVLHEGQVSFTLVLQEGLALWGWWGTRALHKGWGCFHTYVARGCCTRGGGCGLVVHEGIARGLWGFPGGVARGACKQDFGWVLHEGVARGWCRGFARARGVSRGRRTRLLSGELWVAVARRFAREIWAGVFATAL